MNYNRNLNRFNQRNNNTQSAFNLTNEGLRLMGGNEGGLFGQFGIEGAQYGVKEGDTFSQIAKDNNLSLGELMRLNPELANQKGGYNSLGIGQMINMDEGTNSSGLLGSIQKIDDAFGNKGSAGLKKLGTSLAETGAGKFIKGKFAEFGGSALGKGLSTAAGAVGPIAGAYMAVKGIDDAANKTIDRYDQLESGIKTGQTYQMDLKSKYSEAKNNLLASSGELKEMVKERKGNLVSKMGSRAEEIMNTGDVLQSKSNLESSDSTNSAINKTNEGLITAYLDNSNALGKQLEKMNKDQLDLYSRNKQGLIAEGQQIQSSVDDMQQQQDDMETSHRLAKGWKSISPFG